MNIVHCPSMVLQLTVLTGRGPPLLLLAAHNDSLHTRLWQFAAIFFQVLVYFQHPGHRCICYLGPGCLRLLVVAAQESLSMFKWQCSGLPRPAHRQC
jgi:hypothetical protein